MFRLRPEKKRFIIIPPSHPGSKGDEGMLRGLLQLLTAVRVILVNMSEGPSWLGVLGEQRYCDRLEISEIPGPVSIDHLYFSDKDALLVIGADVIDGTCGVQPSMDRLRIVEKALEQGACALIFCSFRSNADPLILDRIQNLKGPCFLIRDNLSLANFKEQTGIDAEYFPDLFAFCERSHANRTDSYRNQLLTRSQQGCMVLGLNFSEHSFRSFFDEHTPENRRRFVTQIISAIRTYVNNPYLVLISNDSRSWDNFPSDHFYQLLAREILTEQGYEDDAILLDPAISYPELLALTGDLDATVTGRMHLSLACLREGTIPLVLMGKGRGYTSLDKMQGMFRDYLGDADMVCSDLNALPAVLASLPGRVSSYQHQIGLTHAKQTKRSAHWKAKLRNLLAGSSRLGFLASARRTSSTAARTR